MLNKNILAVSVFLLVVYMSGCLFEAIEDKGSFRAMKTPVSSVFMKESEAKNFQGLVPIRIFFIENDDMSLKMQIRYVDSKMASESVERLAQIILEELQKGPNKETGLDGVWGEGVELVSDVYLEGGIVLLDFNEEFFKKLQEDESFEQLIVYSIVNSLTQVRQVERVKFLKEGKEVEDYGGKLDINSLFHRNPNLS